MSNKFYDFVIKPLKGSIESYPDKNAFCINENFYSYKEFGQNISKIRLAISQSKNTCQYFGLVVNDDIETYSSIIALWLEGLAFIALHPNQPFERNKVIIAQMDINFVLDSSNTSLYQEFNVLKTNGLVFEIDSLECNPAISDDELAYVLFTSGSTGKPKGVTIKRGNIGAFIDSFWATGIKIIDSDRCLQTFDLTFDVSIQAFITPILKGACVYTVPHEQIKYSYVFGLLEDHEITFAVVAPSMLRYLKPYFDEIDLPKMKYCIVTAEASPVELISEWQQCIPNADIYNFYGPTEATIYCTYYKIPKTEIDVLNGMISIGEPLKNVKAIIINEQDTIVKKGETGELCVAGDQITPGYWNNLDKNREAFIQIELEDLQRRFYRTGDLCYLSASNNIMLLGRLDSQFKIQGYRVELGEIEFHARAYLDGKNVCVIPLNNPNNNTELIMFVESEKLYSGLKDYLKEKLPSYMIPTKFFYESIFPLNSNSKVDKIKLKDKIKKYD